MLMHYYIPTIFIAHSTRVIYHIILFDILYNMFTLRFNKGKSFFKIYVR